MRGGESFCFTSDRESLFRELVSLREQVVESQREIQRLKGSESYQVGLFCTWPFRKAWRIIRKACNEDPKGHLARNNS
jgi:hypothetical protein